MGNGDSSSLSQRKLQLYNTKTKQLITEQSFLTPILAVKMNKKRQVMDYVKRTFGNLIREFYKLDLL